MEQRNFLASFETMAQAKKAALALHNSGFTDVQTDYVHPYPGEGVDQLMNPITGNIPSLSHLTLDATPTDRSAGILISADNAASGMSDDYDTSDGQRPDVARNVLLTVVTTEKRAKEAERIIKQYGGEL